MPKSTPKNLSARVEVSDDVLDSINEALAALGTKADEAGLDLIGPRKVAVKDGKASASAKAVPVDLPDDKPKSVRARQNIGEDDLAAAAAAAVKSLHERVLDDGLRLTGTVKVAATTPKKGEPYVTASGRAVPQPEWATKTSEALASLDDVKLPADLKKSVKAAHKALRNELKRV